MSGHVELRVHVYRRAARGEHSVPFAAAGMLRGACQQRQYLLLLRSFPLLRGVIRRPRLGSLPRAAARLSVEQRLAESSAAEERRPGAQPHPVLRIDHPHPTERLLPVDARVLLHLVPPPPPPLLPQSLELGPHALGNLLALLEVSTLPVPHRLVDHPYLARKDDRSARPPLPSEEGALGNDVLPLRLGAVDAAESHGADRDSLVKARPLGAGAQVERRGDEDFQLTPDVAGEFGEVVEIGRPAEGPAELPLELLVRGVLERRRRRRTDVSDGTAQRHSSLRRRRRR
mmetsp:Transcript_21924/g.64740  ORF Transcript_21924/g.64740 Transcript_21924/m.64740 type:complete len:287 (+) Transcript_21924:847-1707(+)